MNDVRSTPIRSAAGRLVRQPLPTLENGDRLTQREFHRRYEAYPENVKIELIGGVVYMSSPARRPHGRYSSLLGGVLNQYEAATPGVEALENFTTLLDDENEPQPDKGLRISDDFGGQSRVNESQYILGAPELLAEIAHSSVTIDLSDKKDNYQRGGVCEYIVVCVEEKEVIWFDFKRNCRLRPDSDGIIRSRFFPGLWLDVPALFAESAKRLAQTLNRGLASPAHRKFVEKLAARRKKNK